MCWPLSVVTTRTDANAASAYYRRRAHRRAELPKQKPQQPQSNRNKKLDSSRLVDLAPTAPLIGASAMAFRINARCGSIDDLGNVVVDVAPVGVGLVVAFDHLCAFFLAVCFEWSQGCGHDL